MGGHGEDLSGSFFMKRVVRLWARPRWGSSGMRISDDRVDVTLRLAACDYKQEGTVYIPGAWLYDVSHQVRKMQRKWSKNFVYHPSGS